MRYEIDASLDPDEGVVSGTVAIRVASSAETGPEPLLLQLYPERFAAPPGRLDERNAPWIYPGGFDAGRMEITSCRTADGTACRVEPEGEGVTAFRVVAEDGAPAAEVVLGFRTVVPERFGLFGRADGVVVLGGGWHPLVAGRSADGRFGAAAPVDRADYRLRLHLPAGTSLIVDGEGPFACGGEREAGCRVEHASDAAEPPSVIAAPEWHERSVAAAGMRVRILATEPVRDPATYATRAGVGLDPASLPDLWSVDRLRWALRMLRASLRGLEEAGFLPPAGRRPEVVTVVVAPLRMELAAGVSGAVLLSDRAYELFPIEPFFRFQDLEVLRAVVTEVVRPGLAELPLAEARWTAEAAAAGAVEIVDAAEDRAVRRAEDILKYGAFLPVIDQMMFAPTMQFRDAYQATEEETDSLRDEVWRFPTDLPRGRRVWAKLRDRLGPERAAAVLRAILASGRPLEAASSSAAGDDLAGFRDTWLGAYPAVNLRLEGLESAPQSDGTWRIVVRLRRDGDVGAREFVTVRVELEDGTSRDVVWDSADPRGELVLEAPAPAEDVEIDPAARVVQDAALAENHPRADDVSSLPWRLPVLEKLRLSIDLTEIENTEVDIDFVMRRRYDLRHAFRTRFTRDVRGLGGSLHYIHGFGPPRDMNRPSWAAVGYLEAFRHDAAFAGSGESATTMDLGVLVNHDERWYDVNPADGWQALLALSGSFPLDDSGAWTVRTAGRAFWLWTPAIGHTLAFYGGFGLTFGEPLEAQLEALGDRMLLAAFEPDEALGRAKLYAVAEYRHVFTWDIDLNLFHLAWLRGIQGVLFGGAGTSSRRESLAGLFEADRVFFEAGYGLRLFLDYAGVQTGLVALDVAVPFVVEDGSPVLAEEVQPDRADPSTWRRRPALAGVPFGMHLSFTQTF